MFLDHSGLDAAGGLHFLVLVVEVIRNHRLGAVFVRYDFLRGQSGRVIELLVVGPVGATENSRIRLAQILNTSDSMRILTSQVETWWILNVCCSCC